MCRGSFFSTPHIPGKILKAFFTIINKNQTGTQGLLQTVGKKSQKIAIRNLFFMFCRPHPALYFFQSQIVCLFAADGFQHLCRTIVEPTIHSPRWLQILERILSQVAWSYASFSQYLKPRFLRFRSSFSQNLLFKYISNVSLYRKVFGLGIYKAVLDLFSRE